MRSAHSSFDEHDVLHALKHFLPAQSPLKDFIHHNTLHSFQNLKFYEAIRKASAIFGYKVSLTLSEFRALYASGRIREDILEKVIGDRMGKQHMGEWKEKAISKTYDTSRNPRIGVLRANWKDVYRIDLDLLVQPILFRTLCSYLDQGIAIWNFPVLNKSFLTSVREMEKNAYNSFFKTTRARTLLLSDKCSIESLLKILVGDETLFAQYIYDQQFAHQGWSGMVSAIEDQPETLVDRKKITIQDIIIFELLLEIDALDHRFGEIWAPIGSKTAEAPTPLFAEVPATELSTIFNIWQDAYEWTYYDEVFAGLTAEKAPEKQAGTKSFQAMFCIDDRECSLRRYLENYDPACETFGTPGFFSVEFFFQPENGKSYTKLCPAPITPKYLIKAGGSILKREKDAHLAKHSHGLFRGALISQTLGFWSAFRLFLNIFRPTMSPATASSFKHMDRLSKLTIKNQNPADVENGLQIGFTTSEMADRVETLLKSIGLVKDFAPVIYVIGHGSSSVNNPHYAAYDCGACSGRPGSVNARVISAMANDPEVRSILNTRGLTIPTATQFLGGLHDTTRDEIAFFDEGTLSSENFEYHRKNEQVFTRALDSNSKERSRRLASIDTKLTAEKIHKQIITRSVSLFEPRPELNHATNTLCIIGRRELSKDVFLDRRAFMNSYDYRIDADGKILTGIMKPIGPVCGGINLEYFFSRVDNQKLGAGTKLPHNVMGLFGVANGIDGDLRPGLPSQMIEVHDPIRLMVIVEHFPEVVLRTIQSADAMYEWFINEWVHLTVINPETKELFYFKEGAFTTYQPLKKAVEKVSDLIPVIEANEDNIPVYLINQN